MKKRLVLLVLSVALSPLLSGCLVSTRPLITAANSDTPFPAHFRVGRDDKPNLTARVDLSSDSSYVVRPPRTPDNSDTTPIKVHFKQIADNVYAVSRPMIEKKTGALQGYMYGYMRINGRNISMQWPDCAKFDPAALKKSGVKATKDGMLTECQIPSVDALGALLMSYLSDPKNTEDIKSHEKENSFHIIMK